MWIKYADLSNGDSTTIFNYMESCGIGHVCPATAAALGWLESVAARTIVLASSQIQWFWFAVGIPAHMLGMLSLPPHSPL